MFGHHGKPSTSAPLLTTPSEHGNLLNSQNAGLIFVPAPRLPRPRPSARFVSTSHFGFFPRHRRFGFAGCPVFAVPGNSFFFGGRFNCFNEGFFLDPFLFGFFGSWDFYGSSFGAPLWYGGDANPPDMTYPPEEPGPPDSSTISPAENNLSNSLSNSEDTAAPPANPPHANPQDDQRPVTLLQLRDGSMYGLTDYWVEDAELHYKTTYGGQNSVSFDKVDFEKTLQLNADRGVPFILRPNHVSP
jgi:hypothetical protein